MREKLKSRKMRTILITILILVIGIVSYVILSQDNKKESLSNLSDKKSIKVKIEEKEKVDDLKVEEKEDESATEENKSEVSNISKEKEKKETTSQSTTNTNDNNSRVSQEQATNTNQSVKSETNSNNNTTQQTNVIQNTTPEPVHEQTEWEKLGISEYDYYNSPMWNWARVDYKVSDYGSYELAHQNCINAGLNKQETDENLISFSCTQINSYSGNTLGDMLRLKY